MAIKYADLGITEEIRSVVSEVKSGEIHLFDNSPIEPKPNPFDPDAVQDTFVHYLSMPIFSVRNTFNEVRDRGGSFMDGTYKVTVALPELPLKEELFAYINFSDEAFIASGVVDEFKINLSTLVEIFVDTTRNIPFDWEYIKANFATEVASV